MKIRPTVFNASLAITPFLMLLAYHDRGYFALGGEVLLPIFGLVAHYTLKDWWSK